MTRVLVTGGAGFIGSHTVELLLEKEFDVVILDNFRTSSKQNIENIKGIRDKNKKLIIVQGDIRDPIVIREAIKDIDAVIHLAAIVSVDEATKWPELTFQVNAEGTLNILEALRRFDVEKIVYASSSAVYGDPLYLPIDEKHPLFPKNPYGASKLAGEALVNAYHQTYGLKAVVLRYFNVYGPRMPPGLYSGVILKFIKAAIRNDPLVIFGDGTQLRDFVYVTDVARANVVAVEKNISGVFNIGTGSGTSILDLAKKVIELTNSKSEITFSEPRPGDIKKSIASIERAKKILTWRPEVSLEEGLKKTIRYYVNCGK
ncbi:MAG: SDR family NAD(P)-dependent oxidoreductase [Candidatus Njordarchaeales archaeon]